MQEVINAQLRRDCNAVQIPQGTRVILPRHTSVDITQQLGGTFTVHASGALYRIDGQDADALGLDVPNAESTTASESDGELSEQQIWDVLRSCYDPEIPVNIVDLGLVYDMEMEPLPENGYRVRVKMTLTAPGCGMGATIAGDAQQKILQLDCVQEAEVEIVWDPPWHQSMITDAGRRILGL